jgi:hypothetical protein
VIRLRLTKAQESALECRGICAEDEPTINRTWYGSRLVFDPADADALAKELVEVASAEDAQAEESKDAETAKFAREASRALEVLAARVGKHRP